ncbi:MerR family transcriptional regulator [Gorillibacterium timonense]|uniref:MerR family transcriptional regulator n=1 Tax=Gorillibacterium timonense TaxID=1689269 RepID=UPI00071E1D1A|nr:MerR family transcriptional regulator [Gorillibacterium timonense]
MRYTIGQFAGLHHVSKKTLRYYKDIGLLEPAGIDPINGYAFYEDEQHERMQRLQYLRRLRFTLEEIRKLLQAEPESWVSFVQTQLAVVRSERRLLDSIEQELLALQTRIRQGIDRYQPMIMTTEYQVDTFNLQEPLWVIGRAERVPFADEEKKQPMIDHLIGQFYGNDEPCLIPDPATPAASFGLVYECEKDMSMGTYMMGVQVSCLHEIPEGMRSFTLPSGRYARVSFHASDRETLTSSALAGAYSHLYDKWLPNSPYAMTEMLAAEYYLEDRMEAPFNPGMELWQLVVEREAGVSPIK